jgi:hypothetical protein
VESNIAAGVGLMARRQKIRLLTADEGGGDAPVEGRDIAGAQVTPFFGLVLPLWRQILFAGVGFHQGLKVSSRYPGSGADGAPAAPGRYRGLELELQHHLASLGLALRYEILALGATLQLGHLTLRHRQATWAGFREDEQRLGDSALDVLATFEGGGGPSIGGVLGLWLRPLRFLELGLSVALPLTARVSGALTLEEAAQPPQGYSAIYGRGSDASTELQLPLRVQGGVALAISWIRVTLEAALDRWSEVPGWSAELEGARLELITPEDLLEAVPLARLPLSAPLRDHVSLHVGLILRPFGPSFALRSGYAFHRGGTRPEAPSPVLIDLDRHVLAMGVEAARGDLSLALAFSTSLEASLDAPGEEALMVNPLDGAVTRPAGRGTYHSAASQILLEVRWAW